MKPQNFSQKAQNFGSRKSKRNEDFLGNKKGMSAWVWILIILIVIAVGVGVWFWLSGGSAGIGISIPQPPALPSP